MTARPTPSSHRTTNSPTSNGGTSAISRHPGAEGEQHAPVRVRTLRAQAWTEAGKPSSASTPTSSAWSAPAISIRACFPFGDDNYLGQFYLSEPSPTRWQKPLLKFADGRIASSVWQEQAAGLGAVWARENTREAIWDALKRKEVYATSGDRLIIRVFAGWDFVPADLNRSDFAAQGYARGVPMGGDLSKAPAGKSPAFMVRALRDPYGPNLDRIQIVKGWLGKDGQTAERIFDVAVSGGRKIGPDGRCMTPVGSTVDVANATYDNSIGAAYLTAYWKDPAFDPTQHAFYYVRVIQIPTPRWTAYDQKRFGIKMAAYVPMASRRRAYTSPIWYEP